MSSLISPVRIESTGGLPSWFRRIVGTIAGWPAFYRAQYARNPRRVRSRSRVRQLSALSR